MLSILIVSWNTREMLSACLKSIERFPPGEPFETIVLDNASGDESAEMVRGQHPSVRLIEAGRNLGYAEGSNSAFEVARGEMLLTLNPDTEIEENSLDAALRSMREHPRYGALAARLIGPDGATQRSVRGFPTLTGIFGELTGIARLFQRSPLGSYRLPAFDYERMQDAPQPMGTFLLFRRAALQSVGDAQAPFDPAFPIFFNEVDLLYRMSRAGWPALYDPSVRVRHFGGASTRQARPAMIWESHRSLLRYLRKHGGLGTRLALPLLSPLVHLRALIQARGVYAGFRP